MAILYINLPVADLARATEFYDAIGFIKNEAFSNEHASAMAFYDQFYVMLLTHDFAKTFLPAHKTITDAHTTCEVLNAIQFDARAGVDEFVARAIAAGGKLTIPAYDHGFMYGQDFEDLDGHIREAFCMDASQMHFSST